MRVDPYTCAEAFRRLADFVDRELPPEEVHLVQEHLEVCEMCAKEFDFEARVIEEIRAKLRVEAPKGLFRSAMDRAREENRSS